MFLFTSFMFHVENERQQQHRQIDMAFSDLLCEIEMSFDYFRELSIDKNDDICRHLDKSTSEVLRLSEKYKSLLFMYYGKKMEGNICNEFDKLREDFLFIHHSDNLRTSPRFDSRLRMIAANCFMLFFGFLIATFLPILSSTITPNPLVS